MNRSKPYIIIRIVFVLGFITTFLGFLPQDSKVKFFLIPDQELDLDYLMGDTLNPKKTKVASFQISELITFKEYKKYLKEVRIDSSEVFYNTQLPDSNIAPSDIWNEYITSKKYDNYPVLGLSWNAAMNYCKWLTLKETISDSSEIVYRLPYMSEWLCANYYLEKSKLQHDFNKKYSDWLIVPFDESRYNFNSGDFWYDYFYFHSETDPPSLKRKRIIGSSYLFNGLNYKHYGYSDRGYNYVSFRLVKEKIKSHQKGDIINFYFEQYRLKSKK